MYKIIEEKLINYGTVDGERTAFVLAHIVCDTASDKPQPLPHWVAGSRCDVLENNGTVYLLSNARQWEQVNFYNQGGEGGEFDPDDYYTKPQTDAKIAEKVDKIAGKGLSTEDYTTEEKTKLAGLSNYDDTALSSRVDDLEDTVGDINTILEEVL